MNGLALQCDKNHDHAPWGVAKSDASSQWHFATSEEAEYPRLLCQRIADVLCHIAVRKSFTPPAAQCTRPSDVPINKRRRLAAFRQPQGHSVPPLISEFQEIVQLQGPVPPDCRLLRVASGGEDGQQVASSAIDPKQGVTYIVGRFRSPQAFCKLAEQVSHPADTAMPVHQVTIRALCTLLRAGPAHTVDRRTQAVKLAFELVRRTDKQNAEMLGALDPHAQRILRGKKLVALKQLLVDSNYPDLAIVDDIISGCKMSGVSPAANGIFARRVVPATHTKEDLLSSSCWVRRAILAKLVTKASPDETRRVWDHCMDEVKAGWISGPCNEQQMNEAHPGGWLCTKRFALAQGKKFRIIDDCLEAGSNKALTTVNKLSLHDVDYVTALARLVMNLTADRSFRVELPDGSIEQGTVHEGWQQLNPRSG
jgi:hypothetical protein